MGKLTAIYKNILEKKDLRKNLIDLKMSLREKGAREELEILSGGNYDPVMRCLSEEDPKVRKNAAAVLGEIGCQEAVDVLADAWEAEDRLFVRAEYLKALGSLDCRKYVPVFQKRLEELQELSPAEGQIKHIREEMNALSGLLQKYHALEKHRFTGFSGTNDVLLLTHPAFTKVLDQQIYERHRTGRGKILVHTDQLKDLLELRPVKDFLFLSECRSISGDPRNMAEQLMASDLLRFLGERLEGKPPYYFRADLLAPASPQKSEFLKKTAAEIERAAEGAFYNRTSGYEIEFLFAPKKDGSLLPLVRFSTLPDHRFAYRREKLPQDIRPEMAAGILELVRPWLRPHGQVLDPFCCAGTLLIERNYLLPARSVYGIDRYGKAVEAARKNTAVCGMEIYYVNRDFFDFTHGYLFDEILTDLPGNFKGKKEKDDFYRKFLEKSAELLAKDGVIVCRCAEMGTLKKQLRLHKNMRLVQEIPLNPKKGDYVFVLKSAEV